MCRKMSGVLSGPKENWTPLREMSYFSQSVGSCPWWGLSRGKMMPFIIHSW